MGKANILFRLYQIIKCSLILFILIFLIAGFAYSANPKIAGGEYHSLALKSDGTVWAWGANWFGQLGSGQLFIPRQSLINLVRSWREIVDFDGDGKTDIAVWRPESGYWYILRSSDQQPSWTQWGAGFLNDIPVPGDYDGDGITDIAVWRPGDGYWYILRSSDQQFSWTQWGSGSLNDRPISQ